MTDLLRLCAYLMRHGSLERSAIGKERLHEMEMTDARTIVFHGLDE